MSITSLPRPFIILGVFVALLVGVTLYNYLFIKLSGTPVPAPDIPRGAEVYGKGRPLTYVVIGDSTTISQGGDYDKGYARESARFLADSGQQVTLHNIGQSGARVEDVAKNQVPEAVKLRPDIVLMAVGANDVTHLTGLDGVQTSFKRSIDELQRSVPDVRIFVTGSPQMGAIPRFPQPSRYLAGVRTGQINGIVRDLVQRENVYFVPIADKTGPVFDNDPGLYARDKFHPNTEGYKLWTSVIVDSLRRHVTHP